MMCARSSIAAAAVVVAAGMGSAWASQDDRHRLPCTGEKDALNFRAYSMGPSGIGDLPRTDVVRVCDDKRSPGNYPKGYRMENYVSVFYGACAQTPCAPPVEVQSWPACVRNRTSYWTWDSKRRSWVPLERRDFRIRGVPAAVFETSPNNARVEVYTGRTTVVIFAASVRHARRVARRLVSESRNPMVRPTRHRAADPAPRLPEPAPGALTGRIRCAAD